MFSFGPKRPLHQPLNGDGISPGEPFKNAYRPLGQIR